VVADQRRVPPAHVDLAPDSGVQHRQVDHADVRLDGGDDLLQRLGLADVTRQ
jgi:hypothetical protein